MRYGVGGGIYSGMQRRASGSGGLGEHVAGLRRAEGLEGEAALGHAVARELARDRGHELLGPAWKSTACVGRVKFDFHTALYPQKKYMTWSLSRWSRSLTCAYRADVASLAWS